MTYDYDNTANIIYDLEDFTYRRLFLPLASTYKPELFLLENRRHVLTIDQIVEFENIKPDIKKKLYTDSNYIFEMMDSNENFKEEVIFRIKRYAPTPYKHLDPNNKLVKFITAALKGEI